MKNKNMHQGKKLHPYALIYIGVTIFVSMLCKIIKPHKQKTKVLGFDYERLSMLVIDITFLLFMT